jgi:hypothetical protein
LGWGAGTGRSINPDERSFVPEANLAMWIDTTRDPPDDYGCRAEESQYN